MPKYRPFATGGLGFSVLEFYLLGIEINYLQSTDIEHLVARSEAHDSDPNAIPAVRERNIGQVNPENRFAPGLLGQKCIIFEPICKLWNALHHIPTPFFSCSGPRSQAWRTDGRTRLFFR